ncbi:MAG: hypothetical protein NDJ94_23755 [Vicinamibacteria bacterium]|nr:hypothetical protein [Vicinamibacteria bacterium]
MAAPWTVRTGGSGFPPLVWGGLALCSAALLVASLLTSVRMVVFGRDVEGRIVDLTHSRRITWVAVEYPVDGHGLVRSSRGGFNSMELVALAESLGRYREGEAWSDELLIGTPVTVRYAIGRPTMAHIKAWRPLYREFLFGQLLWTACAALARLTWRLRSGTRPS